MLVKLVNACHLVQQAKRLKKHPKVHRFFVEILMQPSSQGTNYDRIFSDGSLRRIHLRTTTLRVVLTTREQRTGFSKAVSLPDGNLLVRFYGFTENVRSPTIRA